MKTVECSNGNLHSFVCASKRRMGPTVWEFGAKCELCPLTISFIFEIPKECLQADKSRHRTVKRIPKLPPIEPGEPAPFGVA
jgi:hypothetical protein